jgi:hypothetical protein
MTPTDLDADTPIAPPQCFACGREVGADLCACGGGLTVDEPSELLTTADCARRLGCHKDKLFGLLKANAQRYGAWKQKGSGIGSTPYRERWRIPAGALELLRGDLAGRGGRA